MDSMPKPQRFCIFCGGSPITAEHLWPEWMAPLLGKQGRGTTQRFGRYVRHPTTDEVVFAVREHLIKGRRSTSATMSVLCDRCNNEWGSLLETAAAPALKKLVKGDRHVIRPADLAVIVRWLTLKFFVADGKDLEAQATLQSERAAFRESFAIPDSLRISLAPDSTREMERVISLFFDECFVFETWRSRRSYGSAQKRSDPFDWVRTLLRSHRLRSG